MVLNGSAFAQSSWAESLFVKTQEAYRLGRLDSALKLSQQLMLLDQAKKKYDFATLSARVNLANGKFQEAEGFIAPFWDEQKLNSEILDIKWRIASSNKKWAEARKWSDMGVEKFPSDSDTWNWRRTISSYEMRNAHQGLSDWTRFSDSLKTTPSAQNLKTELLKQLPRTLAVNWWNAQINEPQPLPWNLLQLEYGNRATKLPWNVRGSYGAFFGQQALQVEGEVYPKLRKNAYGYVHLGLSPSGDLFPNLRASAEYYKALPKGEWSVGLKHLRFTALQVSLVTAHAERDFGNAWNVGGRTYFGLAEKKVFPAQALWLRKNWPMQERWLQADLQVGQIPYAWIFIPGLEPVFSVRTGIQAQIRLNDLFLFRPLLAYEREEYYPNRFRNRLNSQFILQYRF
jgi:YaiO family outer membrane protein